jgi:hypothetical protein
MRTEMRTRGGASGVRPWSGTTRAYHRTQSNERGDGHGDAGTRGAVSGRARGPETTDALVAAAPVGSRVRWTNTRAPSDSAFHHENAVKLAADTFAAAGIDDPLTGNEFTRDRLEIRMALMTASRPTRADIRRTVYIDEVEVFQRP